MTFVREVSSVPSQKDAETDRQIDWGAAGADSRRRRRRRAALAYSLRANVAQQVITHHLM